MKKCLALFLALCLPAAAAAEVTANGVAKSEIIHQITAPFSGVLEVFEWETGDRVAMDEKLLGMQVMRIYAPVDGTLTAQFADVGDLCSDVISQYGMLGSIEKDTDQLVAASTTGAYNDAENRQIHIGERVYLVQSNDRENEGEGRVIAVNGSNYTVELLDGNYDQGDNVKIYRDDNRSTKSCIGSGNVERAMPLPVVGEGRILKCEAEAGDRIQKGELLYELASPDAGQEVYGAEVISPADGTVELAVMSGQQVYKGQLLARVHELGMMNIVAEVDEMDLDLVSEGDSLTVVLDRYPDQELTGFVTEIGSIGIQRQNASYYPVTIRISTSLEVLPGMNATVWLSR